MKEFNGVKIIGIDHGYGNIKSSCTVTPTGLFKYETEPVFSGNILEYNGTYYRVGEGHKEFIADKSTDDEYYIFTLMAIARELSCVGNFWKFLNFTAPIYVIADIVIRLIFR